MNNCIRFSARLGLIFCLVFLTAWVGVVAAVDEPNSTESVSLIDPVNETAGAEIAQIAASAPAENVVIDKDNESGSMMVGLGGTESIGVFRSGQFILKTNPISRINFGIASDKPVVGDWDGDGKFEVGVFRASGSVGQFILDLNNDGVADVRVNFGLATDKPVSGDWDDDGYYEIGVFRASGSLGQFILDNTNNNAAGTRSGVVSNRITYGLSSDVPVPIDWNDDGRTAVAVWRPSTHEFIIQEWGGSIQRYTWGMNGDKPVRTWDSGGLTRYAVYRPSTTQFIIKRSSTTDRYLFGMSSDTPVTGKEWKPATTSGPTPAGIANEIFTQVNAKRTANGRTALIRVAAIDSIVQTHANNMAAAQAQSHTGFSPYDTPGTRTYQMNALGYGSPWGENVAQSRSGNYYFYCSGSGTTYFVPNTNYGLAYYQVESWFNHDSCVSPPYGHRDNILNAGFTHTGIACALGSDGYYYCGQDFSGP